MTAAQQLMQQGEAKGMQEEKLGIARTMFNPMSLIGKPITP